MAVCKDGVCDQPESSHIVQLFDDSATLAETVAAFVHEGLAGGDVVLAVATEQHWRATTRRLSARGVSLAHAVAARQLVVRDAPETLDAVRRNGAVQPDLFDGIVGTLVRGLVSDGSTLRVYGEMVDLLVAEGDLLNTLRLEGFWNELAADAPFQLLCGYSSQHFGNPAAAGALQAICRTHSRLRSNPTDALGDYLAQTVSGGTH